MKQHSPWTSLLATAAFFGLAVVLGSLVFLQRFQKNFEILLEEENLRVARLAAADLLARGTSQAVVSQLAELSDARVTVILPDGGVIADSSSDPGGMDNHAARPEIIAAAREGWGHSFRPSATLSHYMIYTAVRLDGADGKAQGFLRVARSLERLQELTLSFRRITWIAGVVVVLMGLLACYLFLELRIARRERVVRSSVEGEAL